MAARLQSVTVAPATAYRSACHMINILKRPFVALQVHLGPSKAIIQGLTRPKGSKAHSAASAVPAVMISRVSLSYEP
jgi:hypothetical protein